MSRTDKNIVILGILLYVVLIAAYANHFNNGFHFDDWHTIVDNVYVRDIKNIPLFFSDPKMFSADPAHWTLRPVVTTTLAIDYWLGGGLYPFYFQLSTFLWFMLLGVLLFFLYRNLLHHAIPHPWSGYLALTATAWYMLHTAIAETLNYIIARSDVLSTFCIVSSLLIYISYPGKRKWFLYVIPALIGVFAKETVLALVIILFFYILLFEQNLSVAGLFNSKNRKIIFRIFLKILPLFIVVLAAQLYTISTVSGIPGASNPLFYYLLTQTYVWLHYFLSFFLPLNLSADTDWTVIYRVLDARIIIGLLFIILLVITIFKTAAKKETKPIAFGLIWFSTALLPTSVAPLAEVTNDHRMFFPFIGLALSAVSFIGLWLIKAGMALHARYQVLTGLCAALVLGFNAYGAYQRNKVWKNEESLWLDVTKKSPLNGRGLMNYGLTQMEKGNYAIAEFYYKKAENLVPRYNTLSINMGILKGATHHPKEADENFKKAIVYSPNTFDSYAYYARFLLQTHRINEARQMAEKALRLNPYCLIALHVLMNTDNILGLRDKLQQTARQTLAILPNDFTARKFLKSAKKPY